MKLFFKTTLHFIAHQAAHLGSHRLAFLVLRPLVATEAAEHLVGRLAIPLTILLLVALDAATHHLLRKKHLNV